MGHFTNFAVVLLSRRPLTVRTPIHPGVLPRPPVNLSTGRATERHFYPRRQDSNTIVSVVSPVFTGTFSIGQLVMISAIAAPDAQFHSSARSSAHRRSERYSLLSRQHHIKTRPLNLGRVGGLAPLDKGDRGIRGMGVCPYLSLLI